MTTYVPLIDVITSVGNYSREDRFGPNATQTKINAFDEVRYVNALAKAREEFKKLNQEGTNRNPLKERQLIWLKDQITQMDSELQLQTKRKCLNRICISIVAIFTVTLITVGIILLSKGTLSSPKGHI